MIGSKCIFALVIFSIFQVSFSLVPLPDVEENDILKTEDVIRSTTNTLFSSLGLIKSRNVRIKQHTLVLNYFVSLTLQDYNNLREITKLTRVYKTDIDKVTADLIAVINEIAEDENNLNLKELTSFEVHDTEKELKKNEFLKAFYDDQEIDKKVLDILDDETHTNAVEETTFQNLSTFKKDNEYILDKQFFWRGHKLHVGRRLYDSKPTKIKHFGFMASIEIFSRFQCAGNIIKSDLVITAASCLQLAYNNRFFRENPPFLTVRVGSTYFEVGGDVIKVLEVYFYPSYVPRTLHHNIAIMRLHRRMKFHKKAVKKIEIDTSDNDLPYNTGRITIVGWGAKSASNSLHSPWESKLRYAEVAIYDLRDCQDIYSKEYVTHKNFCSGYMSKGSGACNRDVGGPGIAHGKLVGIISFGAPVCGTPDAPTVFVKVGYYLDWIEDIMEQNVPYSRQKTTLKPTTYTYATLHRRPHHDHGYHITPFSTNKVGKEIIVITAASAPKTRTTSPDKKELLRELLNIMKDDNEIEKSIIGAFKSKRLRKKPKTARKTTPHRTLSTGYILYDYPNNLVPEILAAADIKSVSKSNSIEGISIEQSQFYGRTKMDAIVTTFPNPSKLTANDLDYNGEDSIYSGLQIESPNMIRQAGTIQLLTTTPDPLSGVFFGDTIQLIKTTNAKPFSDVPHYEISMEKPTEQSLKMVNREDKQMQEIVSQPLITSTVSTVSQPNRPTSEKRTQILKEQEYKDAEFDKDIFSILTDDEVKNETLREILKDYVVSFLNQKDQILNTSPVMLASANPSLQGELLQLNNETVEILSTPLLLPNLSQYFHGTTNQKKEDSYNKQLASSLTKTFSNSIVNNNRNSAAEQSTPPLAQDQTTYNHFSNTTDTNADISTLYGIGRSSLSMYRDYNTYTTDQKNESFSVPPTVYQTSHGYFPNTTHKMNGHRAIAHETQLTAETNIFKQKRKLNRITFKSLIKKVELSKYLSSDDIAAVVKEKNKFTVIASRSKYTLERNTPNRRTHVRPTSQKIAPRSKNTSERNTPNRKTFSRSTSQKIALISKYTLERNTPNRRTYSRSTLKKAPYLAISYNIPAPVPLQSQQKRKTYLHRSFTRLV